MIASKVIVVRTGTANLASVLAALRRLGVSPKVSSYGQEVERAKFVVLPGVGTLSAGMDELRRSGLVNVIKGRIDRGEPTLAICLGMQMLCQGSEESPDVLGLGAIPGRAARFPKGLRVPQLGWNRIEPEPGCRFLKPGYAFFANSYRLKRRSDGWAAAFSDYGGPFVAAMEQGDVLACQFHPELSGQFGLDLMRRWLSGSCHQGGKGCSP
jgi:glutamine amidotransferase